MSAPQPKTRPCVLFVDDERRLVEAYVHAFEEEYDVHIATSAAEGLQMLRQMKNVSVVISDFHMPEMDGATFLQEVMNHWPQITRILLTGTGGLESAKEAVNRGQIFRFLTKPCLLAHLRGALESGVAQHRLLNTERMVLQETLVECISALMEVLSVTNPVAFGRSQRIKSIVNEIAARLGSGGFWQLEAAALLSQIGYFAVNPELAEKMYYGRKLNDAEKAIAATVPGHARRLLESIPRLEPVIQILAALEWNEEQLAKAGERMVGLGSRILAVALEIDSLGNQGFKNAQILAFLRQREARYGKRVLDAAASRLPSAETPDDAVDIPLRQAIPGMRLRQEIRTPLGALLVPIGMEISARLLDRISQVAPALLDLPTRFAPSLRT